MLEFSFHHIGIAVEDLSTAIPVCKALFRYELTAGPFDDLIQNVSVCFLSRKEGDVLIELVAPLGPNSPIDQTLKKGGGIYHVCYSVADIDEAIRDLIEKDSLLLSGPVPAVAFQMRKIAWVMTEIGLLIELLQE
jgi:methylmalonyl-CoA/ethylmalonyl-CoA epimerase